MIIVYPFSQVDQDLALKNAKWMNELGGCHGHEALVCYDARCDPATVEAVGQEMLKCFDKVHRLIAPAAIDGWPEGANYFFRIIASWMDARTNRYPCFMWLEPDAIPLREGWLDTIANEYKSANKPFMGDRVQVENIPLHMSGVGIYPNPLHQFAGEAYRAAEVAWDMAGKDQIVPQAHFTKLIEHAWKHPKFTSIDELDTQIRPECVLFHSSKDGSLIDLLQRKRGMADSIAESRVAQPPPPTYSPPEGMFQGTPTKENPLGEYVCDIFIRTYPKDYQWLMHCLHSIQKFCTGFRKVWVVSPEALPFEFPIAMPFEVKAVEWKQMNDESEDGYLAQQITKMYADVITDYQPDYICHVDSDVIFTRSCSPQDFFLRDKLIWYYTPYDHIETPWRPITSKFMGVDVPFEFMRRFPIMVPRWLYPRIREFCHKKHGQTLSEYIRNQPLRAFSEFNVMGAYAYGFHHEKIEWVDTIRPSLGFMPEPFARQFHSWDGITPEVKKELDEIFSGRAVDTSPLAEEEGARPLARSLPPSGIRELSNGIWIIEGDTHIGKWIEQQERLDHDQNALPDILPFINEGDVVVDGGAFVGDHTIAYYNKVGPEGEVHAFEPNPLAMECLRHNLPKNYRLSTYQVALGDKDTNGLALSGNNNNYGGAYLGSHMPVANVSMMRLDDLHLSPDFIKLDVEGCEVKALIGMEDTIRRRHPTMVIEVNETALRRQGHTVGQLYALLESHGYETKILQENCCMTSPLYDIVARWKKSPEVSNPDNGSGGFSRCTDTPPSVISSTPIFTMLSAIAFLKAFAETSTNHRQRLMINLAKSGLTPRWPKRKKKNEKPIHSDKKPATLPPDIKGAASGGPVKGKRGSGKQGLVHPEGPEAGTPTET